MVLESNSLNVYASMVLKNIAVLMAYKSWLFVWFDS